MTHYYLLKLDLLMLELEIGKIAFWYLLNLPTLITRNLEIGAKQTTILIHQVLTI